MGHRPLQSNPCYGFKKFAETKRKRYLKPEELARLGRALTECERDGTISSAAAAAIRLLIFTGARQSEILTLEWEFVDLTRRRLLLPDSKTGEKLIPLNAQAVKVLEWLPRTLGNPYVIVGGRHGQHLVNIRKPWGFVRERAGLDDVRLHDLRHSFASVAVSGGASLPMVGALLGHTQPQTTARYAHLADSPVTELNDSIGDAIERAMDGDAA